MVVQQQKQSPFDMQRVLNLLSKIGIGGGWDKMLSNASPAVLSTFLPYLTNDPTMKKLFGIGGGVGGNLLYSLLADKAVNLAGLGTGAAQGLASAFIPKISSNPIAGLAQNYMTNALISSLGKTLFPAAGKTAAGFGTNFLSALNPLAGASGLSQMGGATMAEGLGSLAGKGIGSFAGAMALPMAGVGLALSMPTIGGLISGETKDIGLEKAATRGAWENFLRAYKGGQFTGYDPGEWGILGAPTGKYRILGASSTKPGKELMDNPKKALENAAAISLMDMQNKFKMGWSPGGTQTNAGVGSYDISKIGDFGKQFFAQQPMYQTLFGKDPNAPKGQFQGFDTYDDWAKWYGTEGWRKDAEQWQAQYNALNGERGS